MPKTFLSLEALAIMETQTMRSIAIALAFLFCAPAFAKCYEDVDRFKGSELRWCGAWGTGGVMLGGLLGVDPVPYLLKSDGAGKLFIRLVLDQNNFMFISAGDDLVFITDSGERISLKAARDGSRDVTSDSARGVHTTEHSDYPITLEQFKTLARANAVEFAAYTGKGRVERKLRRPQLKIYNEFLDQVLAVHGRDVQ